MLACPSAGSDRWRCPTKWELWRQTMALLPRGRAFQTHDADDSFAVDAGGETWPPDLPTPGRRLTVLGQFWAAFAEVDEWLHQRACALIEEFYCATTAEQRREWEIDYGFPDPCEPWTDLCAKVAAQGGATCSYLTGIAAARGWALSCSDCQSGPVTADVSDLAVADCSSAGCSCPDGEIYIVVNTGSSPAYAAQPFPDGADQAVADASGINCPPGIEPLVCLIERWKPAHVRAYYNVV